MAESLDPMKFLTRAIEDMDDPFDLISNFGQRSPHLATVLVRRPPRWDVDGLGADLRRAFGHVRTSSVQGGLVAMLDDGPPFMIAGAPTPRPELLARSLRETPWPRAKEAVARAKHAVTILDSPGLPPLRRALTFERLVHVLLRHVDATAVHWSGSQCLIEPGAYAVHDPNMIVPGVVQVRIFRGVDEAGQDLAIHADTLGLAAYDLPDIECRFVGLPPDDVAHRLHLYGRYLLEHDDVLTEGSTVDGVGAKWRCLRRTARVEPHRPVVLFDVDIQHSLVMPVEGVRCPACGWKSDGGPHWECDCGFCWNTFDTGGVCPACEKVHPLSACPSCHEWSAHAEWRRSVPSTGRS